MKINWFPGHMKKTLRVLEKEIKEIDAIIYVLDARAPISCINPEFVKIIGNKPIIYVLNKADMVNEDVANAWCRYFQHNENSYCVILNSTNSGASKTLVKMLKVALRGKVEYFKARGANKILRAMVIGVPNSGKSTLVNNLCGKAKAVTGNKPGVTKSNQWVNIDDSIAVLDTPGTLWPNFENERQACNLAFIGSIKDDVIDTNELALELVKRLSEEFPENLTTRYKVSLSFSPNETLEAIARKKGFKLAGGEVDYDRICAMIINDFRNGKLGKITLDMPNEN